MRIKGKKEVVQEVTVEYKCDQCGKLDKDAEDWVVVEHYHSQWGNDSGDSREVYDLCSPECYLKQLKLSFELMIEYETGMVDDKPVAFVGALLNLVLCAEDL